MNRLKFYNVNDKYIRYLHSFDIKVPFNKNQNRPYVGIVIEINSFKYFAPMFSPKKNHMKYEDNPTYIKIGSQYGIIRFNNMIPVIDKYLKYINFDNINDIKYKNLLLAQNRFIQSNTDKIRDKAEKLYKFVTIDKKVFFVNLSCNFKLLKEKAALYSKLN